MSRGKFDSICPDSTRNNARRCTSDERCSAAHGTGRADAELIIGGAEKCQEENSTASARTVPGTMLGDALQTSVVLPFMVLEGQMRNL